MEDSDIRELFDGKTQTKMGIEPMKDPNVNALTLKGFKSARNILQNSQINFSNIQKMRDLLVLKEAQDKLI